MTLLLEINRIKSKDLRWRLLMSLETGNIGFRRIIVLVRFYRHTPKRHQFQIGTSIHVKMYRSVLVGTSRGI